MVIVLDDEAAAHNALGFKRYEPGPVEVAGVGAAAQADVADFVVEPSKDRKEYRREWMRRTRAKRKGEGT